MSSAYKRNDRDFQKRLAAIADKRDADRAYYETLIGRPLETRPEQKSATIQWWMVSLGVLGLLGWAIVRAL